MCCVTHDQFFAGRVWPVRMISAARLADFVAQRSPGVGWLFVGQHAQICMGPHKHECVYFVSDGMVCADRRAA